MREFIQRGLGSFDSSLSVDGIGPTNNVVLKIQLRVCFLAAKAGQSPSQSSAVHFCLLASVTLTQGVQADRQGRRRRVLERQVLAENTGCLCRL
jgi:hypothetical protein